MCEKSWTIHTEHCCCFVVLVRTIMFEQVCVARLEISLYTAGETCDSHVFMCPQSFQLNNCVWAVSGTCDEKLLYHVYHTCADDASRWLQHSRPPNNWAFSSCPMENECLNGHHTCSKNEQCFDAPIGYTCECKGGYARNNRFDVDITYVL
jgi:hypothetical protein